MQINKHPTNRNADLIKLTQRGITNAIPSEPSIVALNVLLLLLLLLLLLYSNAK